MTNSSASTFFGLDVSALAVQWTAFRRSTSQGYLLLEFRNDSLLFSEAYFQKSKINYRHVGIQPLPDGSVELGVPVEPVKMSGLLQQLCKEKGINVHRCAIVLPPEASFLTLVRLPASLSAEQAWDFVQSPDSGLQIPIPLQQTDFDLIPLQHLWQSDELEHLYLLSGVPNTLVDSLIETLNLAGFELSDLCLAMTAQARLLCSQIVSLDPNSFVILLEFHSECTNALILSASGPLSVSRLASIREFPQPNISDEILDSALMQPLAAESMVLADDRYLPISELDIQVLVAETKELIQEYNSMNGGSLCEHVYLSGSGSSHPGLETLLRHAFQLPVSIFRASESSGIGTISMDSLLLSQSLGRLLGLGLHLMPDEMILQSSESSVDQSDTFSASSSNKTSLNETSLLLAASLSHEVASSSQNNEDSSTQSFQSVDQDATSNQSSLVETGPSIPSLSPISSDSSSEKTLSLDVDDRSVEDSYGLDENISLCIDLNVEQIDLVADELDSQPSELKSNTDGYQIVAASDASNEEEPIPHSEPNEIIADVDSISKPFLDDLKHNDETISRFNDETLIESPSSQLELASSSGPLPPSTNIQDWPSIHDQSSMIIDDQASSSGNDLIVEDVTDVEERESADIYAPSTIPDQIDLSSDERSSALTTGGTVDSIQFSNGSELLSDHSVHESAMNQPEGLDDYQESESVVSSEEMMWPSIRDVQSFNEAEPVRANSTSPHAPIHSEGSNQQISLSTASSSSSTEVSEDLNKSEDSDVTDRSVGFDSADPAPQGDEDSFGELKFSDD